MALKLGRSSALNLELPGTFGSFRVGRPGEAGLVRTDYLLTRIGLDLEQGPDQAVLQHLAPVRELFDVETLGFEELLQRDIDDARVSHELIPYLLDEGSRDAVKLFPPIVIVVLPLRSDAQRPAALYPPVTEEVEPPVGDREHDLHVIQSGVRGGEAFRFERPVVEGGVTDHDLVRLRLNTNRVGLAIVDGQHRAMALLALYRNLKGEWSDARRAPYRDYYTQWPDDHIRGFDLKGVSLPMMFCTFPELTEEYAGEYDVLRAARSIFLVLNKTARPVSTSRNRLLDDDDLVSLFLRRTLSMVKHLTDSSKRSLRIHCVELDQAHDRTKVSDEVAITGVNHVFYLIEHLFVGRPAEDVQGINPARVRRYRSDLEVNSAGCDRIEAADRLGAERMATLKRDVFDDEAATELGKAFDQHLGRRIVRVYEEFEPFERHSRAVLQLSADLKSSQDTRVRPILLEGQGIARTFEAHRNQIKSRLRDANPETVSTALRATDEQLDGTQALVMKHLEAFRVDRARRYLEQVTNKGELRTGDDYDLRVVSFIDGLYRNLYSTVAFQTALICVFFDALYLSDRDLNEAGFDKELSAYLDQLSAFFIPKRATDFRRLVNILQGEMSGTPSEWNVADRSPSTFRQVAYRGEMQPDQWPRYKALFLEIWQPHNKDLARYVQVERNAVRQQVIALMADQDLKGEARRRGIPLPALEEKTRVGVIAASAQAYRKYLERLDARDLPSLEDLKTWADTTTDVAAEEEVGEED